MRKPGKGRIVSQSEMADILGMSREAIMRMVRDGAPVETRGKGGKAWKIATGDFIEWIRRRDEEESIALYATPEDEAPRQSPMLNPADPRSRERTAQAIIRELEASRALGETITIHDAAETVAEEYAVVKSRLFSIPARVAGELCPDDPARAERILKREISDTLASLTDPDQEPDPFELDSDSESESL